MSADEAIQRLRIESKDFAITFRNPSQLPELIAKELTRLMQQTFGKSVGLAEWERKYLEFRLPAWRSGRTAQGRPHLFDTEDAEQLDQPGLYVEMDGVCHGWSGDKNGKPVEVPEKKRRTAPRFLENPRVALSRWVGVEGLPRIALVGAPGGGKTIFLTRIASSLASACLGRPQIGDSIDLERLRKNFGLAIPIVLEATKIPTMSGPIDVRALVAGIVDEVSCCGAERFDSTDIERNFREGRYLLLIDALDEIASATLRADVLTMLKGIAGAYPEARFLLTTRSARYTGALRFGPELTTVEVAPLSDPQVETLCANWTVQRKQDNEYRNSLIAAATGLSGVVSSAGDDQGLTENPLMLTAICVVFERYRSLPDDRGRLCELLVEDLCRSRRSEDQTKGWRLDENGKKSLLQRIAFAMQDEGAQSWPVDNAITVARQFVPTTESNPNLLATRFVDWAADHTGILRFQESKNGTEQVRFWHRLFREHLVATQIAQLDSTAESKINELWKRGRLCDPFWEDVIRLLPRALGTIEKANSVRSALEQLADTDKPNRGRRYGLAMAGVVENRALFPELRFSDIAKEMGALYESEGFNWHYKDRLMFLEALGRLDPKSGDPRLNREVWIQVPGRFDHGSPKGRAKQNLENPALDLRSWIAKHPVTVQEFNRFVNSSDLQEPALWAQMPPLTLEKRSTLRERVRSQLSHPNWPIASIGVGEAIAYCRWRTRQRTDGLVVRLPLSSEWNEFLRSSGIQSWKNKDLMAVAEENNFESRVVVYRPSPVGAFPPHVSGVSDALTNVWEWCVMTHSAPRRPDRTRRYFGVFGDPYLHRIAEREFFTEPPGSFEYSGERSIGFRCVLAATTMDISSVSFSRPDPEDED